MEIQAVIVKGELPKNCKECVFWNNAVVNPDYEDDYYKCDITQRKIDLETRPDWCPLITTEQLLRDVQSPFREW